jgi:hypothetical protein
MPHLRSQDWTRLISSSSGDRSGFEAVLFDFWAFGLDFEEAEGEDDFGLELRFFFGGRSSITELRSLSSSSTGRVCLPFCSAATTSGSSEGGDDNALVSPLLGCVFGFGFGFGFDFGFGFGIGFAVFDFVFLLSSAEISASLFSGSTLGLFFRRFGFALGAPSLFLFVPAFPFGFALAFTSTSSIFSSDVSAFANSSTAARVNSALRAFHLASFLKKSVGKSSAFSVRERAILMVIWPSSFTPARTTSLIPDSISASVGKVAGVDKPESESDML